MEIPYWTWFDHRHETLKTPHEHKADDELLFSYSLLSAGTARVATVPKGAVDSPA